MSQVEQNSLLIVTVMFNFLQGVSCFSPEARRNTFKGRFYSTQFNVENVKYN